MKELGLLFKAPMVRAILSGQKTQTRRLDAQLDDYDGDTDHDDWPLVPSNESGCLVRARPTYGEPGLRAWVRETWHPCDSGPVLYAADYESKAEAGVERWFPGIHLRRVDARITLEVTGVRVERLQEITEEEAKAEGADPETHRGFANEQRIIGSNETKGTHPHKLAFAMLWDEINIDRASWLSNPWVWVVSFRRVKP